MNIFDHRTPLAIPFLALVALMALVINPGCKGKGVDAAAQDGLSPLTGEVIAMKDLANKTVLFQHESVGANILDGIRDLMREDPRLKITITGDPSAADTAQMILIHERLGRNGDPIAKIDHFKSVLDGSLAQKLSVAFLKLCYVDVTRDTDIGKLFGHYRTTMDDLQQKYPDVIFAHLTVPLTRTDTTWKTWIKNAIGIGSLWEYDDNIARGKYNDLLRKVYGGGELLFDIATLESIGGDGRKVGFVSKGASYQSLAPEYTADGGHLNEEGRVIVAGELLRFLASYMTEAHALARQSR